MTIKIKKIYTEKEIETLYRCEKTLREAISWRAKDKNHHTYVANVDVFVDNIKIGSLHCRYNIGKEIFFRLQTNYNQLIRSFHYHEGHINPDNTNIGKSHKHKFSEFYDESIAYEVNNVDTLDINQALLDFLEECNIKVTAATEPIPLEKPFMIDLYLDDFGEAEQ